MLCFLVWCIFTLFWAQNLEITKYILGGYVLRFVLFMFLIANEINSEKTLNGLMNSLAIAGWLFIIVGIGTILSQGYRVGTRLQILEENENTLGILFPVVLIGVLWPAVRLPKQRRAVWILLSFAFIFLSFILVALSGSRGGAITWLMTMLFLLFWRETRLWGIIGLLIIVAAVIFAPFILSTTIDRFLEKTNDTLLGGREALWQSAWTLIQKQPLKGVGIGNAPQAMMSYIRIFRSVGGVDRAVIHNPLLTIWVETGFLGLLLYLGVFAQSVWSFVREYANCRKLDENWIIPYFTLTASAFVGYFASWIKGGGMELSFTYFLILALLLIPSHLERINDLPSRNNFPDKAFTSMPIYRSSIK
jgi:O-antigen ligase